MSLDPSKVIYIKLKLVGKLARNSGLNKIVLHFFSFFFSSPRSVPGGDDISKDVAATAGRLPDGDAQRTAGGHGRLGAV